MHDKLSGVRGTRWQGSGRRTAVLPDGDEFFKSSENFLIWDIFKNFKVCLFLNTYIL